MGRAQRGEERNGHRQPLARTARANGSIARMRSQANDESLVSVGKKIVVKDKSLEVDDGVE